MKKKLPMPTTVRISVLSLFLFFSFSSQATDFIVSNGANSGAGSLRQAILDANADAVGAPHTITFTVSGVITITSSLPAITRQVTIDGGNTVTVSGPGGNNTVALFVLGAGSNGSTIRNFTMRNTGIEPIRLSVASSGVTIENMVFNQTGPHYLNHGILANAAVSNLTIRNVTMTGQEDKLQAIYFGGTVTNVMIDKFNLSAGAGLTGRGIHIVGAVNGLTIKNSTIDLDDPATTDDGDYGLVFAAAANNVTIDSSVFRDCDITAVYFGTTATNINIKNTRFDNLDGHTGVSFVNFRSNTNTVTIDKNIFDAKFRTGTNDGDYGVLFYSATNQSLNITNNRFNEHDTSGVYIGRINTASNHDNVLIQGNTFTKNGHGGATGAIDFITRNTSSDGGPILITENTFIDNNGVSIFPHPGNTTSYVIPNFTISKNIIYNTKSTQGAIRVNYIDKINITENSIYNNQGLGIELAGVANCGYEGTNTPAIVSSTETTPGTYNVVVKLPSICGTGNCSVEIFSNEAGIKGVGGQHYVTTRTGLSSGNNTLTAVTGTFPEVTGAPYGTWTATLKINNNCATSEFSNKKSIKPNGPAGISNGIALWLRGDELSVNNAEPTASGQVITGWDEFSGVGPSATTVINNPLTKLNGINFNPVADMDGDGIRGLFSPNAPSWITTPTTTTVAVFNPFSITASGDRIFCLFSQAGSDYNTNFAQIEFYRTGNNINSYRGNTLLTPAIPGTTGVSAFDKVGVFSSVTSAANHTSYYNGASMGAANYNKGNFAISQWFVGTGWNTTDGWSYASETDFAEVFTYNRVLTAGELQKVQSYMALKYGVAMKQNYILSDSTVVWNVTTNAAHSKEIAALARDIRSVLYQKQARAFNSDEVISIASGNVLAATNNDNADSIINNLSVFMWGNDSASTALTTAFTAGTFSSTRMARVWKVQKTNWVDKDITIQLKNGKANNYLLISTDPTFATITQELQLSSTGTITLSSSLLPHGIYFTFGRQQKAPGGVANGLSVWTKADEGVTMTGTNATAWEDQGPSQRVWPWANTAAINRISSSINFNPSLQFAANYFRINHFTPSYTQGEVFSVQSSPVNNVASFPWQLGGSSGSTGVVYRWTDNNMYLHFGVAARRNFLYGTKNLALPVILNVNTAANSWTASLDGRIMSGPTAVATSFTQASGLVYNYIGAGHNSVFQGLIPEVILYNRKLNATERQQVNSYLAIRYGITMDQTSATDYLASDGITTMWKASDNTGFNNNIAGIGRDEIGSLYQKQSRSINTAASGNLIAVAVGELAISNEANTDTIPNNKSFLTWGDDNAAVTYTTTIAGSNVTVRMPRVWKVDKTNWADRDITIKLYGSPTNTYLLISNSSSTFSTIDHELPVNPDSTITINSSLLPDGAYITFGKELKGPGFVNTGVQFWVRADDGISAPSAWYDYSGNDNDATQGTVANQPVAVTNGTNFNPAFDFDGTNDFMDFATNATISGTNLFTIVSVTKRGSVGTTDVILGQQSDATNSLTNYFLSTNKYGIGPVNVGNISTTGTYNVANIPYINATTRSAGNLFNLYTNGGADGSGTQAYTFLTNNVRLGTRGGGGADFFDGNMNEVAVYNRPLNTTELQQVHSYLGLKYGITLSNGTLDYLATDGTTRMWTVTKNTGYTNNIAGLGRDDKTALYQKQSRSVNDTTITIAAGNTVAADNASNTASIDELSFFTWADNGAATTFSVAITGVPNATSRMARVWKVDRTGWADQDITIKVAQGGERYLLVNATDPAFGAGTAEYAIATATGTVTIHTSNFPDGAYFTLGTKIVGPGCVNNGIAMWLRADYSANVNSWADFSGNQTNAAQATAANQPAVTGLLNYNTALQFNGTTDYLQIPQATINGKFSFGNSARTLIGVGTTTSAAADQLLFSYGSFVANQASGLRVNAARAVFEGSGAANGVVGPVNSFPANKVSIMAGRYVGGPASTASLYTTGTTAIATGAMSWATTISAEGAQIGKYVGEVRYWNGNIGEVIVYNRDLTDPEFQRVSSYLALKYGLTLDQTTPTDYIASDGTTRMWTAADNTGYNFRITGIGRDDCTDLYQKQSLSADAGILAVAIGDAVETTNNDNLNTIDNNNSYFVFADDNASILYNTTLTGLDPLTARMARIWKVDKTNWTDAGVTFKLTGGNEKIYLLVSSDAVFDGADASYQLDASGNVTVTTDLIPDGAYFSFAKALSGPGYVNVGVQLWLRADDNVSAIDNWLDYSGNDNHAAQPTAANQPVAVTSSVNYNPAFDFDGANDYMDFATNGSISGTNLFTVASVSVRGTTNTHDAILSGQGNIANNFLYYHTNAGKLGIAPTGSATISSTGTYATASIPYISAITRTTGNLFSLYTNGSADGTGTQAMNFLSNNLRLGNRDVTADLAFDGNINEVVVYNKTLSAAELRQVHSYLALKYGITMSGDYIATDGTTSYWTAANNTGYLNNITGIGRDDKTALYQKQSRSVNTASNGNMVAIGLGAIAATNKDNANTISDDLSFLVWGDNGAAGVKLTEYPTALDPGACSKITRLQREWKVQVTGNPGSVQLQVFLAGLVPNSTGKSDLKLLIDDDGDFSSGTTSIIDPALYDDVTQTVTFNDISFSDGQYFTLVTDLTNQAPGGVIANLYTWLRADKGVTTATGVSVWGDQSLTLKDATQATAGSQPAYNTTSNLINFNPTLTFDGINDVLSNTTISHSGTNGEDMFAVVLPNSVPAGVHDIVGLGTVANTGNSTEFRFSNDRLNYISANGVTIGGISNPSASLGVQLANANKSNTGAASILLNGSSVIVGTIAEMPVSNQLNLGARRLSGVNGLFFNGRMAEVVLYNRQLTATERPKVASYLAIKYGITLLHNYVDPAGTVLWDVTLNTGYNSNITGISRDDCNGLHQKQSKSVNAAEAMVTVANYTGIFLTNAANPNSLDNNTALLLGDNNGNRVAWTATGAPLNRERLARVWRVQESGNIGTVTIQVPANSSTQPVRLPLEKDNTVYLLVSTSGDFVNDFTEVPMILNGTDWEATYDFSSGQYFTFATNDACVSATSKLTTYGTATASATDKCYINGWILFKDPVDATRYIAAVYDPAGLIDRTKITATVSVNSNFPDIGKGNSTQAARLMRRMLQLDCVDCFDEVANPNPNFTVRMFYSPTEKSDAESVETNNMESIKTTYSLTGPSFFKWFKAADKTAAQVVSGLTPAGIAAGGQEWADGTLITGEVDGVEYIDFTSINSFSTFGGIWTVNILNVLPVTWLGVQAIPAGNNTIKVKWTTVNEINNAGFVVERSQDGQHYQPIASVAAQASSPGSPVSYSIDDINVTTGVLYYYRIKQTNLDGQISYSRIVSARLGKGNIQFVQVKPNPVTQETLRWEIYVSMRQQLQVSVIDMSGKVIKTNKLSALPGANSYTMDMKGVNNGVYLLRIEGEDGSVNTEKFIKL